jgi:DNA-binding MarR family transcriptional regulator
MLECATAAFEAHGADVSFTQWVALTKVKEKSALTASDLCRTMYYDNGAVTRLIDQLEQRGLLTRERSTTDRRVVALKLTAAGEKTVVELVPIVVSSLNQALSDFSKAEFAELVRLLHKLISRLKSPQATVAADSQP